MRLVYISSIPTVEGKVESTALRVCAAPEKDGALSAVVSLCYSRPANPKDGPAPWGNPTVDVTESIRNIESAASVLRQLRNLDAKEDKCRLSDPASVIQAIERDGGGRAIFDPRIGGYVAVNKLAPKGSLKFFPLVDGEPVREQATVASTEESAQKRLTSKFLRAIEEDPDQADVFAAWLKNGKKVQELPPEEGPEIPTDSHYYVSKTREQIDAEIEEYRSIDQKERKLRREERKAKKEKGNPEAPKEDKPRTRVRARSRKS